MADINIPAAALEAGARAIADVEYPRLPPRNEHYEMARAACLAMLGAWPGMHIHEWQRPWLGGMSGTDLILPLTEASDDPQKA